MLYTREYNWIRVIALITTDVDVDVDVDVVL